MLDDRDDNDYDDLEIEYDKPTHSIDLNSYSGCFRSFFVLARLMLGGVLILGLSFLMFRFSESITGYIRAVGLFLIFHIICEIFGWKLS